MAYDIPLPEEDSKSFQDYLDVLRRRGGTAAKIALALLLVGLVAIFLWPNRYQSTATILIEDPEIPPGLVPTTVTTMAARQVQYINQRVMTRTNLAQIIEKFDLFQEKRKYLPTLLMVPDVQKDIRINVIDAPLQQSNSRQAINQTIAFQVGFEHESPSIAQKVANELVSLYLAENVRSRTEQTAQTSQFMQAEVERLDAAVRDVESQIAVIKKDNKGALPEERAFNLQLMQRADSELTEIDRQIKEAEQSRIILDAQLAQLEPMSAMMLPDGRGVAPPADQLRALESQLAMLEGRYSEDHPDVVRTRRDVEALRKEVGEGVDPKDTEARITELRAQLASARERYSDEHPEVIRLQRQISSLEGSLAAQAVRPATRRSVREPNNPAYIQVQAQREALDAKIVSLRAQRAQVQAKMAGYEHSALQTSDVERQLSALQRRLVTTSENYKAARDRLFVAQMGETMETQSKGERFSLVEPPDLPLVPSSPNRPVLLVLLLVMVLAVGLGWPQLADMLDGSINSARAVERVAGVPPLAEIPLIQNAGDIGRKRRVKLTTLVAVPAALAVVAVLVHFFVINLDVAWYVALRKLGM
ncbi:MAG: hypothetical protein H3C34_04265 [Caldilineaceae bacterium]|nr:hypothetical protein [Caldilineaceae bacterium]